MSIPLLITTLLLFLLGYIETSSTDGCAYHAYYLVNGKYEFKCESCSSGYYKIPVPNSSYVNCGKCEAENCYSCSLTPSKCSSCKTGYYFEGEICKSCSSNCFDCEDSPSNCISCSTGEYLSDSTCYYCDDNCYSCKTTATHCTSCRSGNYLNNTKCFPCDSNCKTCAINATNCLSCRDGEYLSVNATCLPCDSNCNTCKTNATNCLTCHSGAYLTSSHICEGCPSICKECENSYKCTSCINNYFLYDYECLDCNVNCKTTSDGCKCNSCGVGYYLDKYQCLQCDSLCITCLQQDLCTQCIPDYYKKENDPLNSGQSFKCYKEPDGYYLDNDIYKECYQSCKECSIRGNKTYHNCSECKVNLSFEVKRNEYINCYENCSNYYYFDGGDNFHCTFNKSCPDNYPYLLENKFECIEIILDDILSNLLGNGLNGTESREEQIIFYDNILSTLDDAFTSGKYDTSDIENGIEQILKAEKLTITFTTTQNQKNNINNNINNNMTTIDLGECETLLRESYHIPDSERLYIKKIDVIQEGMKTVKVEYEVYAKLFGTKLISLNLTVCEKSQVSISIPITITDQLEKLNSSSSYYNDVCYTTTSEDGTDITVKDRQNDFIDKDRVICQDGCYFSEYDYGNSRANCSCNIKKCSESYAGMYIDKSKILDNFKNINNLINFKFLVCYKNLFNKEGIIKNIGFYLLLLIMIFHAITILIFSLKQFSSIIKKIEKISSEKLECLQIKDNHRKFKYIRNRNLMEPIIYQIAHNIYSCKNLYQNFYDKRLYNDSAQKMNLNKIKIKKFKTKANNKKNTTNYIDEEINGFSYDLSLKIDKRTYCQYYASLLKTQHNFICAIFNNSDYNSGIVKIDLFVIGLTIEYIVNALFYNDDTMHKIYKNKGLFDLETQLPIAIYSTIISTILNYPLDFLALSNDAIINYKQDTSKINIKERAKKLKKILTIKFTLYFIISFLFLLFFWYYISMFDAIYKNTQLHLLKDTLISIGLSFIFPFGIYLLPGIFRIPSLTVNNNKRKCLYNFSKLLQSL